MIAPRSGDDYREYKTSRQELALGSAEFLPLGGTAANHPELGLHPGMPELKALFDQGTVAFIANVGSLVHPITLADFKKKISVPLGLFSHSDQVGQWMTAVADRGIASGWAGRASDLLREQNVGAKVSMNISLAGNNLLQYGRNVVPYSVTPNGSIGLKKSRSGTGGNAVRICCRSEFARAPVQAVFLNKLTWILRVRSDRGSRSLFRRCPEGPVALKTAFPAHGHREGSSHGRARHWRPERFGSQTADIFSFSATVGIITLRFFKTRSRCCQKLVKPLLLLWRKQ